MKRTGTPIFCDECSALALVSIDDRVLCAKCLKKALLENADIDTNSIQPLDDPDPAAVDGKEGGF